MALATTGAGTWRSIYAQATGEGDRTAAEAVAERLMAPMCHESAMESGSGRSHPL